MSKASESILRFSPLVFGAAFIVLCLVVAGFAFKRPVITTTLSPGDTISATFDRDYRLRSYVSTAKIAGVVVGTVTDVSSSAGGHSEVKLKLNTGVVDKLGQGPSAAIRPTTLLGGVYYVELIPGGKPGRFSGDIPLSRTRIAVELDSVVQALQPKAREGVQVFFEKVDEMLKRDGRPALQEVLRDAPATLGPTEPVFDALDGTRPNTLPELVAGLDNTARTLNEQDGQVKAILASLNDTAGVLDREKVPLGRTVGKLPDTLRTTRTGMASLRGSLDKLTATAGKLEPVAETLDPLLEQTEPTLHKARPVVHDLREVLAGARPLVGDLVPASAKATDVLEQLRGPVDNINGPILAALNSPWRGEGPYAGNGSKYPLYQDIGYLASNLGAAMKYTDKNGSAMGIQVGQGIDEVSDFNGLPNFEQFLRNTLGPKEGPR